MALTQDAVQQLSRRFGFEENQIKSVGDRRIFFTVPQTKFAEIFKYAVEELKFCQLISLTGLDEPEGLSFIYHLAHEAGPVLNLKITVDKNNPVIDTVTNYFPGAEIYEREAVDLLGAKVKGLAPGNRYPLTDDWPQGEFPLRKDFKRGETHA